MITLTANDEKITNSRGFRVANDKLDFTSFNKNPVLLYNHGIDRVIGLVENVRVEGSKLLFDPKFDERDPVAVELKRKIEDGFLRGCSLGFNPAFREAAYEDNVPVIGGNMVEISITPLPANSGAVRLYNSKMELMDDSEIKLFLDNNNNTENMMSEIEKMELQTAKEQLEKLTKENAEMKAEAAKLREQEANALVALAIADGRIGEAEKEAYTKLALQDLESLRKILAAKPTPATTLSSMITGGQKPAGDSYDYLLKNDPAKLQKLSVEQPAEYAKLEKEFLNKK